MLRSMKPATRRVSSIEIMLDEADYDGDDHQRELEAMLELLGSSSSYEELMRHPEYRGVIQSVEALRACAV